MCIVGQCCNNIYSMKLKLKLEIISVENWNKILQMEIGSIYSMKIKISG